MKLSTKARYGLSAMLHLAKHWEGKPVKRKDISKEQEISSAYLENILIALRIKGLIKTTRGSSGGYVLTAKPEKIKLSDIIEALEGSIAPVECVDNPESCDRAGDCKTHILWKKLHKEQKQVIDSMTLKGLMEIK